MEPLSEAYTNQYLEMHCKDVYWTGNKVIKAIYVKTDINAYLIGVDAGNMSDLTSYKSDKRAMLGG
ncbi:hypothetical protein SAMN02910398_03981 [Butyrivibrio sp. YAB3001]|nr:hypothetical protein SAMN02910398_03981 [Butyrivibrio sp. YAB3001]